MSREIFFSEFIGEWPGGARLSDGDFAFKRAVELFSAAPDLMDTLAGKSVEAALRPLRRAFMRGCSEMAMHIALDNYRVDRGIRAEIEELKLAQKYDRDKLRRMSEYIKTGQLDTGSIELYEETAADLKAQLEAEKAKVKSLRMAIYKYRDDAGFTDDDLYGILSLTSEE